MIGADRVGLDLAHRPVDALTPGVLALAIMSTSFTSVAIATGFERRYGVLKRLGATPLPRLGLLAAKVLALLVVEVAADARARPAWRWCWAGRRSRVSSGCSGSCWPWLLGTAAFVSLGLLLAGTLRAEATLAAANLIYLLLLAGGAVVLPSSSYGAFGSVAQWLPSGALGDAMRAAFIDGAIAWASLLCLLALGRRRRVPDVADVQVGVTSVPSAPRWLRPLAWATLVANVVLVVTGGAVRLTGSGLGCPTWPRCTEASFTPHGAIALHCRDRVRQPDADVRAGRDRGGDVPGRLGVRRVATYGCWRSCSRSASPPRRSSAASRC